MSSCIPVSFPPNFRDDGYKVKEAKSFKRNLPEKQAFIFVDTKDEGDFYDFINTKYELYDFEVNFEVPFRIEGHLHYLSFYEVKKVMTAVDIFGITDDIIHESHTYYVALTVMDNESKDCLNSSHPNYALVIQYLKDLKQEYLKTTEKSEENSGIKKS